MRLLLLALVLFLPIGRAAADEPDPDVEIARRHLDTGWKFFDQKSYAKALGEFQTAQLVRPQLHLEINIARCLDRLGRVEEAIAAYHLVLGAPSDPTARQEAQRRIDLLRAGQPGQGKGAPGDDRHPERGREGYEAPNWNRPKDTPAASRFDRGRDFFLAKEYAKALAEFEAARRTPPTPAGLGYRIARCLDLLERYPGAIAEYERFLAEPGAEASLAAEARKRTLTLRARVAALTGRPAPAPVVVATVEKPHSPTVVPPRQRVEAPPPAPSPAPPPPDFREAPPQPVAPAPVEGGPSWVWRTNTVPLIVGGLALVSLATGVALALSVAPSYRALRDTCAPRCAPAQWEGLQGRANAGYAFIGIGVVAAAADVFLWIYQARQSRQAERRGGASVWLAPAPGGIVAGGVF
ncbi:MAG: tetratricopeptide repeat protein [Myxococcales bacterium]|nr:tetratricopeptide repeat protein [Myxococcales bacterium]